MIRDMKLIVNMVTSFYGIKRKDLIGRSRVQHISAARILLMKLLKDQLDVSTSGIADLLDRDHSTVIKSIAIHEKKSEFMKVYIMFVEELARIKFQLTVIENTEVKYERV